MKNIFLALAFLLLTGCANPALDYVNKHKPLAEHGKLAWSAYYEQVYANYADSHVAGKGALLNRINNMIMVAKSYEKGEISADQFNYIRRKLESEQKAENEAEQNARLTATLQTLQKANQTNSQPIYQIVPPVQLRPQVNCKSNTIGNTVYTNCQ